MFRTIIIVGIIGFMVDHLAQFSVLATVDNTQKSIQAESAMVEKLKFITIPAEEQHTATVIFIHGLGDTGEGWTPVADMFRKDPALTHIRWVLPHSPIRPVTANLRIEMPSWFDIYSYGFNTAEDEEGMQKSVASIRELIKDEMKLVDASRIVLGGFSQGAAMSLLTALTSEFKLAGVACLSGWLPLQHRIHSMLAPTVPAFSTPIFWGYGSNDQLVKAEFSKKSVEKLTDMGMVSAKPGVFGGLSHNVYDGIGHTTNQQELDDLKTFIKSAVPREQISSSSH